METQAIATAFSAASMGRPLKVEAAALDDEGMTVDVTGARLGREVLLALEVVTTAVDMIVVRDVMTVVEEGVSEVEGLVVTTTVVVVVLAGPMVEMMVMGGVTPIPPERDEDLLEEEPCRAISSAAGDAEAVSARELNSSARVSALRDAILCLRNGCASRRMCSAVGQDARLLGVQVSRRVSKQ